MQHRRLVALVAALGLSAVINIETLAPSRGAETAASQPSLYKRLGGYDALAAVTDDFIVRLIGDKRLAKFFSGVSTNSKLRIRQLVVDQLCFATGGPCVYIGRDMKTAHRGLGITEADWNASVEDLGLTLDKFKVGAKEREELLGALTKLKGDIIDQPSAMTK